jgi:hypothetical protein
MDNCDSYDRSSKHDAIRIQGNLMQVSVLARATADL